MEVVDKVVDKNKKRVRIIIGNCEFGTPGVTKPIRTILVNDATTDEAYNKIMEALKK